MVKAFRMYSRVGLAALASFGLLSFAVSGVAQAAGGHGEVCGKPAVWAEWHAPVGVGSKPSLQRGARNFMNYCLGCHSLQYMRYNRIAEDLDIPEKILKENLMVAGGTPYDYVRSSLQPADGETWFGRAPPDLTLTARAKGKDYIYRFLKGFYADETKATGVNNLVLEGAAMPHVLASLQGTQKAVFVLEKCAEGAEAGQMVRRFDKFEPGIAGTMTAAEFDGFVTDTTNFLGYVAEPIRAERERLGLWVILFLLVFTIFAWLLKKEIWKDVK